MKPPTPYCKTVYKEKQPHKSNSEHIQSKKGFICPIFIQAQLSKHINKQL